jgi:hypothetical protein
MNEYGKINRKKHQIKSLKNTHEKVNKECTFSPMLTAKLPPKTIVKGDRAHHMYEKAMSGSKLISKFRSDKHPH